MVLAEDFGCRSWPLALPGTRSCPGPGRHRVPRLQQSVLWRRSGGRTPERAPGDTWRSVPLLRSPVTKIHAITWVLFQETQGRAREGVARSSDTDTPRSVPTEDRVDIERCVHHRSQPHYQHRRDVLQDVCCLCSNAGGSQEANSTSSWTRAATSPCSSPPGISCLTCTPNSFFRVRPPLWNPPTYPSLAFLTWLDATVTNPMAAEPHESASWTCVPCTSVRSSWSSMWRLMPTSSSSSCHPTPRPCASRLFKAALGRSSAR